jgi:6-pyruvoyltetrahydropterin/6-carboxytetrahydropterin synthase
LHLKRNLMLELVPRLKKLDEGGYARGYRAGSSLVPSSTQQLLKALLDSLKIPYREKVLIKGTGLRADFLVNGTWVLVERDPGSSELKALAGRERVVIINRESARSDSLDSGIRVLGLEEEGRLQTIFLDDPSFNFDYAHILPKTQKCSVMHGHTSSVLVEIVGHPIEGMVVDFGVAKKIIREAVGDLDHKLFINEKYVTKQDGRTVTLSFETVHGPFKIEAPRATTVLLSGEATVENLATEVLGRIANRMPENVTAVGVYVYEGLNKGSHLLAQIHQGGVGTIRRKR